MIPKLSIVIPIYNAQNFIEKLLDTINQQSFKDYEIVCVNDGSSDNTQEILENYALNHNNMIIINQKNGGIGKATNTGFENAKGEYILQVDHDDTLASNNALEILYNTAKNYQLDILSFNFYEEKKLLELKQPLNKVITGKEYMIGGYHPASWCRLYSSSYLKSIDFKFKEDLRFVDTESYPRIMISAKKVMHIKDAFYIFKIDTNHESVSKTIGNIESAKAFMETAITYNKLLINENSLELIKVLKEGRMRGLISCVRILGTIDTDESETIYKKIKNLNLTKFESLLVKSEYDYFYFKHIKKDSKIKHPFTYLIHRIRKIVI
jgi:glycosyltransferase involved in cell wall biosynthesis